MNSKEYLNLSNKLFEVWKNKENHIGQAFITDGIVNPDVWFSVDSKFPRILFVLKEAYNGPYSLTEELSKNSLKRAMWKRVAEWSCGLLNYDIELNKFPEFRPLTSEESTKYLNRIAVINLRKSNGSSSSSDKQFLEYAEQDSCLLQMQFNLINPDIVIYGNTFDGADCIHNLLGLKKENPNNHWFYKDNEERTHIDFFHPANHYPALLQYYGLMAIYQKSLSDCNSCVNIHN